MKDTDTIYIALNVGRFVVKIIPKTAKALGVAIEVVLAPNADPTVLDPMKGLKPMKDLECGSV